MTQYLHTSKGNSEYGTRLLGFHRFALAVFITCSLLLSGCQHSEFRNGYSFTDVNNLDEKIGSIETGYTDELGILKLLGSPILMSDQGDRTFYYFQIDYRKRPIFHPKVISAKILEITFDNEHRVKSVKFEEESQINDDTIVKEETNVIGGKRASRWSQILNNIGRFDSGKSSGIGGARRAGF